MKKMIDREAYLKYAKDFSSEEVRLVKGFAKWLPKVIIDCHAHCGLRDHVSWINDKVYNLPISSFPNFSIEESQEWHTLLYPGKIIKVLRFPMVFRGIDHKAANFYLLERSPRQDKVALYGLPDDLEYTIKMLEHPRVSALKMYHLYLEPIATEIYQYFPKIILEVTQSRNIPIILHLPRKITSCLNQILQIIKDFPRLKICFAHLGLVKYVVPELKETFITIARYPLLNLDTSLISSTDVITMVLQVFGSDRVMYGSDEPLNLMRFVIYRHPHLEDRLVAEYPYHWLNPVESEKYKELATGATHAHWQALLAIRNSIDMLPRSIREEVKQKIFYNNAKYFFDFQC